MNIFETTMIEILLAIISLILGCIYFNYNYMIIIHKKMLYIISKKNLEKIEHEDIKKYFTEKNQKKNYFLFDRNSNRRWKFITKNKISKDISLYEEDENLEIYEMVK